MFIYIYIYIYIYITHLLLRGFGVTNQTNETSFSFRKILFISTGEIYFVFIERRTFVRRSIDLCVYPR